MRSPLLVLACTLIFTSCNFPGSTPDVQKPVEYSTTQSGSPAALYCAKNGGQVSYEKHPNIPTMDIVYCTLPGKEKIDAWKYMDNQTSGTGTNTISK